MDKKSLGKSIWIIAYSILLCVSVSVAWILAVKPNVVQDVKIDYDGKGTLVIAPSDIEGEVIVTNDDGEEVPLDENFSVKSNEVIPNGIIPFKMRLRNNTDVVTKIDISIVGIKVGKEDLLSVVYFSANPTTGWQENNKPLSVYKQLGDATKGSTNTYSLKVFEGVTLRPTEKSNDSDYLELSCYLYFDGEQMTNAHQNIALTLGAFRITQK